MRDIDFYLDATKEALELTSDRELSTALGFSTSYANRLRLKRKMPTDVTMIELAKHAGISPEQALIDLNIWRSPADAKSVYKKLAELVCSIVILAMLTISSPSEAYNPLKYSDFGKSESELYIMENKE